jgi:hypothetical protein
VISSDDLRLCVDENHNSSFPYILHPPLGSHDHKNIEIKMVASDAQPPESIAMDNINSQPHLQDNLISTANIKHGELRSRSRSAQTHMRRSDFYEHSKANSSSSSRSSFTLSGCETVGIVGSGMAGLVVAFLLANDSQKRYDVEVLEVVCFFFFLLSLALLRIVFVGIVACADGCTARCFVTGFGEL